MELLIFAGAIFAVVLTLVTILLTFVIVGISSRVKRIDQHLEKMIHLMKYGK